MESRGKNGWMLWFIVGVGNRGRLEMVQTSTVFSLGGRMRVKGDEEVPTPDLGPRQLGIRVWGGYEFEDVMIAP